MEMNQPSRPQEPFSSTRAENDDTETGVTTSQVGEPLWGLKVAAGDLANQSVGF